MSDKRTDLEISFSSDEGIETSIYPNWILALRPKATLFTDKMKEPMRGYIVRATNETFEWKFEVRGMKQALQLHNICELLSTSQLVERWVLTKTMIELRNNATKNISLDDLSPKSYTRLRRRQAMVLYRQKTVKSTVVSPTCKLNIDKPRVIISPSLIPALSESTIADSKSVVHSITPSSFASGQMSESIRLTNNAFNQSSPEEISPTSISVASPEIFDFDVNVITDINNNQTVIVKADIDDESNNDSDWHDVDLPEYAEIEIHRNRINFYFNEVQKQFNRIRDKSDRAIICRKVCEKFLEISAHDKMIVQNIRTYLNQDEIRGKTNIYSQHAKDAIWCSMSGENITSWQLSNRMGYKNSSSAERGSHLRRSGFKFSKLRQYKTRKDSVRQPAAEAVYNFLHDVDVTKVDSNSNVTYTIRNPTNSYRKEKHERRFLDDQGDIQDTYESFLASDHYTKFINRVIKSQDESYFDLQTKIPTIGRERFRSLWCPCIRAPTVASCIDILEDKLRSCCDSLESYFYLACWKSYKAMNDDEVPNLNVAEVHQAPNVVDCFTQLIENDSFDSLDANSCDQAGLVLSQVHHIAALSGWSKVFKRRSKGLETMKMLIQMSLCKPIEREDLTLPGAAHPFSFCEWECYNLSCPHCGLERVLDCNDPFLSDNDEVVSLMVWEEMVRPGGRTQTENVERKFPVKEVFARLKACLAAYVPHLGRKLWLTQMRKLDIYRLKSNALVLCTDFSAQVDLRPNKTTTCHVDKHLVLAIFFVFHGRREVLLKTNETISILDCDVFHCLGDSHEKELSNDYDFHLCCSEMILKEYQEMYNHSLQEVTLYTDNCSGQYKGRRTFFGEAKLKDVVGFRTIKHNFAEVHCFKGPWDGQGKIAKNVLTRHQRKNKNVTCAKEAVEILNKFFQDKMAEDTPWMQFEKAGDERLKAKSPYSVRNRRAVFVTANKDEFAASVANGDKNVVLANRFRGDENDCSALDGSASCHQFISLEKVTSDNTVKMKLRSMPCNCTTCLGISLQETCPYKHITGEWIDYERKSIEQEKAEKRLKDKSDLLGSLLDVRDFIRGNTKAPFESYTVMVLKKILKVCDLKAARLDGGHGQPLKTDMIATIKTCYASPSIMLELIDAKIASLAVQEQEGGLTN